VIGALTFEQAREMGQDLTRRIGEGGLNESLFDDWVATDPDRGSFLAWTAWGTIRWRRDLGRPAGPELSAGFTMSHKAERKGVKCADCPEVTDWLDQADVALFDLPTDGDHYVVGYSCHSMHPLDNDSAWMLYDGRNMVAVAFTPGHRWVSENVPLTDIPVHLSIQPTGRFWEAMRERVILEPIEVR
jgi:hypothetical protein